MDALKERNDLDTSQIDDCLIGNNAPIGEQGGNIARTAVLYAAGIWMYQGHKSIDIVPQVWKQ